MKESVLLDRTTNWRVRVADYFSLEHNVTIASAAVFLLGFGEELWKKFLPKYLEALGATTPIIGLLVRQKIFSTPATSIRAVLWLIVLAGVELS
jgi:hypothetical protein